MKKLSLLFLAAVLSMSVFAENDGTTKGRAIPYAWGEGIKVTANAGEGKWYKVDLYGKFDPTTGKSAEGNADANIVVSNPLDEKATVDVTAYIGDNETSRHFTLQAHEFKTMNIGAGMLVRMGIQYVYMYIVMDVTITPAQAEKIEVVVEDAPSNSTPFIPVDFVWGDNWATTLEAEGNDIAKNKETWIKIDMDGKVASNETFEIYVENKGNAATTIYGGLATDCPATAIQEQTKDIAAGATSSKLLDRAMLDMMPSVVYIRLKADQNLHVWAKVSEIPSSAPVLFNAASAESVEKNHDYQLTDGAIYKATYSILKAPEYYYTQLEVTNGGSTDVELEGLAVKNADGDVKSAVSKKVTIKSGATIKKEIDKTLLGNLQAGDYVVAKVNGGNANVTFKLIEVCTEEDPCVPTQAIEMALSTTEIASKAQAANTTKWYAVDITAAKNNQADIILTMDAGSEVAEVTVDVAADCVLGAPTQSYTGKSTSTSKTLNYSLFQNAGNVVYIRVHTNKAITVNAELLVAKVWNGTEWAPAGEPTINDAVRIEGNLTIDGTIKALGVTLAGGNITIASTGKLIVGAEGVKGSNNVGQIVIEDGGVLLIDPAASTNNKPFVTAKKALEFGAADASLGTPRRAEKHEFVALPVDNREATVGIRYYGWNYASGWVTNGFNKTFTGYDIFQLDGDANFGDFTASFKGQLAENKNQSLNIAGEGWHAFGNSWLAPMGVKDIISGISGAEAAVHIYVKTPATINSATYGLENSEKLYIPVTAAMVDEVTEITTLGLDKVAPMQGFFVHATGTGNVNLNYNSLFTTNKNAAPAKRVANNRTIAAAVLCGGNQSDFVFMIEDEDANVHKMMSNGLSIYAEDGLVQVANDNLIGTKLTIQTNDATEYTLSFTWLKGETIYLKDLENGNIIAMTADNVYTFNAEPNTVSERFQVMGHYNAPTGMENSAVIEGANKRIENGHVVIIKNGVKYDVLGGQL